MWIGAGATILPGASVGRDAVIAAGAIVADDVPAASLWPTECHRAPTLIPALRRRAPSTADESELSAPRRRAGAP
ncbi:hypothetical protein [Cellulomonas sp. P5_E12]